jgi:iron complex outermembrane receptor protein
MAALPQTRPVDLADTNLEDLMNMQVTTVSKKEQKLSQAGAAVFVITQEDIRRSGATNIPDLLRMAPGVDVGQVDANAWAISIRGFNDRLADKVLVLIDGRTVYTPTTSGVYWDQQDVPLEDIDRIEIIRGPGGTVWGANAVNGVINIITKSAADTTGGLVSGGTGSKQAADGLLQYGGDAGSQGAYRVFAKYFNTDSSPSQNGAGDAADGWHMLHGGFRGDWSFGSRDTLTVQGDLQREDEGETIDVVFANALPLERTFNDRVFVSSGDVLERWNHEFSNGSDTSLQVYFDRYDRHDLGVNEILNTLDFDFHHHLRFGSRHDVVWGLGYRFTKDAHEAGYGKTYVPLNLTTNLFNGFAQDEIRLAPSVSLTLGAKVEHNIFTGFQFEPSAQLVWTPTKRQSVWISAARAIRQPSREQEDIRVDVATFPTPGAAFGVETLSGAKIHKEEQVRDVEIGYRAQLGKRFNIDFATFLDFYRDLETANPGTPFLDTSATQSYIVFPLVFGNEARARTFGGEVFANWNVTGRWRISPGYSLIRLKLTLDPGSQDTLEPELVANTPQNQFQVHSFLALRRNLDWDSAVYYVGRLRDSGDGAVPAYTRVDSRLGWRIGESVEVSLVGQNLLRPRHEEFHDEFEVRNTLVQRSVFGRFTWRF